MLTVVAIALVSAFLTARRRRDVPRPADARVSTSHGASLVYGIVTGLVAAVVSAPVVAYLFGGVTGSGSTFIVALFLKAGQQVLSAALLSGLAAEPIDKTLQVLLAALLYRATPAEFIAMLQAPPTPGAAEAPMTPNGAVLFAARRGRARPCWRQHLAASRRRARLSAVAFGVIETRRSHAARRSPGRLAIVAPLAVFMGARVGRHRRPLAGRDRRPARTGTRTAALAYVAHDLPAALPDRARGASSLVLRFAHVTPLQFIRALHGAARRRRSSSSLTLVVDRHDPARGRSLAHRAGHRRASSRRDCR